ncbi:trypsin-like peptidase domain-containing protein [Methylobacterium sp. UNC300MFChir4.1]|uniref:trypsin-like serine peptidase n=1 Tax=Methylobacterium sp. UNC300MFChir4.1 TaxID=1502747 RepID=UPI001481039C|nr:trypsin-like peptidase domain-containing protein [Methylobacterium sp. UNC300MFChir4.1]
MPLPPASIKETAEKGQVFRFDPTKTRDENLKTLEAIDGKLEELVRRKKDVDRDRTRATNSRGGAEAPIRQRDRDTSEALSREIVSLDRERRRVLIETRCGPSDDSQDVELYKGDLGASKEFVNKHQPSTALLQWRNNLKSLLSPGDDAGNVEGERWCTGTLLSDNLFVTAGHCFDIDANEWTTPRHRIGANTYSPYQPTEFAPLMQVNFNFQRDASKCTDANPESCPTRPTIIYPVTRVHEHRNGQLDYTIIELGASDRGEKPNVTFSPQATDSSRRALEGLKTLTVIQHPNGVPKRVAAGSGLRISGDTIFYSDIDTLGGSSGAGIIDQDGNLIGIHTNGGCFTNGGENSGLTLEGIRRVSGLIH